MQLLYLQVIIKDRRNIWQTKNGTDAGSNSKRSRNPEAKENLHHGYHAGFNRSIRRGR